MSEYFEPSVFEPITEPFTLRCELPYETTDELPCEVAANTHPVLWKPDEPQYCKAIADYYGVSRKSVQLWFQKVAIACPWFRETELKLLDGRYTPLCVELMGDYRLSGLLLESWKLRIQERFSEEAKQYFVGRFLAPGTSTAASSPLPDSAQEASLTSYSPTPAEIETFELPLLQTYKFSDKRSFAAKASERVEQSMDVYGKNESALDDALLDQLDSEGEMLGVLMFQRKYGKAQETFSRLQNEFAKKSGLVSDPPPPSSAA
jgi:hypothetical protein